MNELSRKDFIFEENIRIFEWEAYFETLEKKFFWLEDF